MPNKNDKELVLATEVMAHYRDGETEMNARRTRVKGWDEIVDTYMGKLPTDWPYQAKVFDPRLRTTILEKTGRLLNSKLRGRLVPRENADIISAKINNALLDYQWDRADAGGSMIEKVADADQTARLFGAAFGQVYWDTTKDCNEIKIIDARDIFIDPAANHISNAKWVQVREFTTIEALKERNIPLKGLDKMRLGEQRSNRYDSVYKRNKGIEDRTGQDRSYKTVEIVTEFREDREIVFAPRHKLILRDRKNPYKHRRIPIAMLRYYPLGDDVYGESEAEPVLSLQRGINALLCGYIETMNLAMRPPIKILATEGRRESIQFNPGARWILNNINSGQEVRVGETAIKAFNNTYPMLVAAFNTAMGDQSLGISNLMSKAEDKTATEVRNLARQQNNRDQYNQLYLAEFLKDIMMMWLSNNQQYLFDDPSKHYHIVQIVGRQSIEELEQLGLANTDVQPEVYEEIASLVDENPEAADNDMLARILEEVQIPQNQVILNPSAKEENYQIKPKLEKQENGEAKLYLTKDDMKGIYDYIPDVKSMAAGAGENLIQARREAMQLIQTLLPVLQQQGENVKIKELLINVLEDAGYKDAESIFEENKQIPALAGQGVGQASSEIAGAQAQQGMAGPQSLAVPESRPPMAQPEGL